MGRTVLAVLASVLLSACGDPLIIVGDLPGYMRIIAGVPNTAGVTLDTVATQTLLTGPTGIAVTDSGRIIYIADQRARVLRVTSSGAVRQLLNHTGCLGNNCLRRPQGIALESPSALLIADDLSDRVWRLDLANSALTVFAGNGTRGIAPDGSRAAQSPLSAPAGVAVLEDGRVLIVEQNSHRVRVVGRDGLMHTFAGSGTQGSLGDGGPAAQAQLDLPFGIAVGNQAVYVSELGGNRVREIGLATGIIRTVAGNGSRGFAGDGGPAVDAAFALPTFLATDDQSLFITDVANGRIRMVALATGMITTFAGTGSSEYNGSGRAAAATSLSNPAGVATGSYGFLYVADQGHHIVWRTSVRAGIF